MRYQELPVSPALAAHVETIWALEDGPSTQPRAPRPIYPDGRLELILNFGDATEEIGRTGERRRQTRALLAGQLSGPFAVVAGSRVSMLGVRFRPEGALAFARVPLLELSDRVVPLEDLARGWGDELLDRLHGRPPAEAKGVVEAALVARSRPDLAAPPAVRAAVQVLLSTRGQATMGSVGRATGLSPRELQRGFRRHVGLSPKRLARILRFQEALRLSDEASWVEVAVRSGYFDQAHLVRDFRELAGEAPARALSELEGLSEVFARRTSHSSKTGRRPAAIFDAEVTA